MLGFPSLLGLTGLWLCACAPTNRPEPPSLGSPPDTLSQPLPPEGAQAPIRFQFIYMVHGDGGYIYHDAGGLRHAADDDAVAQAVEVARNSPAAEVFIFHQKPTAFLGLFHTSDGSLLYYRRGRLVRTWEYDRDPKDLDFAAEASLYRARASPPGPLTIRCFAYFGHEIPVTSVIPYSRSRPDAGFVVSTFARGLRRFGAEQKPFDLIVLSACHGGTPAATLALAPYTAWLLAAPGELHLSYLDTRAFIGLEGTDSMARTDAGRWGRAVAEASYSRLLERTSTGIALALYDTEKTAAYLEAHRNAWVTSGVPRQSAESFPDCAGNPAFGDGGNGAGATVWYRPPRFGADKARVFRSGWECPVSGKTYGPGITSSGTGTGLTASGAAGAGGAAPMPLR